MNVVENVVEGRLRVGRATEVLGLSTRQVKRLKKRYWAGGVEWVYHGNQGRQPSNRINPTLRQQVVELASGRYRGFNDGHLQEKLVQQEGLG